MAEDKDYNIVNTEESLKTIDKVKIDPPVKAPKLREQKYDVLPDNSNVADRIIRDTNYHVGIDIDDYANDINKGRIVLGSQGVSALNEDRANQQGWFDQARNMLGQAAIGEVIGGTIEGIGYLGEVGNAIDYISGEEVEFGNFLTDLGKDTRDYARDAMPIYQREDSGMGDSGWWFSNGVSVASSLSMLIPSSLATRGLGFLGTSVSRGLGSIHNALDIASKMGKYERWMATGITQAVVSRHIENSMEASGVFEEQLTKLQTRLNPKTGQYFTEDEAKELASVAASSTYKADWAMLLQDIPQYLAIGKIFNPITMKMETAGARAVGETVGAIEKGAMKSLKSKIGEGLATFGSEGFEEGYQYFVAERGKLLSDLKAGLISKSDYEKELNSKIGDEEMLTSAFWGGLGGNIFQAVGAGSDSLFKSKQTRENERLYADNTAMYLKERGQSFEAMKAEIAKADQTGDPVRRKAAIDGSGVQMTIEALDNDKFDSYIESLNGMMNMSSEEKQGFKDKYGIELDENLFKEYIPSLIEQANSVKRSYLKHSNKYDSSIAAKLASNDHYIGVFNKSIQEVDAKIANIRKSIPNFQEVTDFYKDKFNTRANILALKSTNQIHKQAIENSSSKFKIENRERLIAKNEKAISKLEEKMKILNKEDNRSSEEKENDKIIGAGYLDQSEELLSKATEKILLGDSINLMQTENIKLKEKSYQQELRLEKLKGRINTIQNIDQAEQAKIDIAEDKLTSKENKERIISLINDRIEVIKIEDKNKEALEKQSKNKQDLKNEAISSSKESKTVVPSSNISVISNLEDEFHTEEYDIHSEITKQSDEAKQRKIGASKNIKLYSQTGNHNYRSWMLNGKDKIGTEVDVYAEQEVYSGSQYPELVRQAIDDFNNGIVNANVYNHLPIKVYIGYKEGVKDSDQTYAYLSARLENRGQEYEDNWARQDFPIRKSLIDEMVKDPNKTTKTKVSVQYGGEVNLDEAVDGIIPENNIGDFQHLKPILENDFELNGGEANASQISQVIEPNLMYTNEYGELLGMNGDRHPDFIGTQFMLPQLVGSSGPRVAMKGVVFLSVPKADGTLFPLKLNIKKHTQEEAEIIASLLLSIIQKENKFNTPLSKLDDKYKLKINEYMQDALNAMESSDPTLIDIVDFHTYVNDNTTGKASELYVSGEWVKFGGQDLKLTPQSLFNYEKLVDFLVNTKRRQFNVKLWQSNPEYRDYAISSGLINTDSVVNGPLFKRNTDVYISAPKSLIVPQPNDAKMLQHSETSKPIGERIKMSESVGTYYDESTRGKFAAIYYGKNGKSIEILRDTKELAIQAVKDKYKAEKLEDTSNTPATRATVKSQPRKESSSFGSDLNEESIQDGPNGEVDVVIKKDSKSNFTLTVKPDDTKGAIVINKNTGKELDPVKDKKLINKALLKSGVLKYEKITNNNHVYAYTQLGTIINITPGSAANGSEIQLTSPVGKKIISQSKRIFDGSADAIEAELYKEMGSQTNTSTSLKIEDVERRRKEELDKEGYRIPIKRESKTWIDEDTGIQYKTIITTFKDGHKEAYSTNLSNNLSTSRDKYSGELDNSKIYNTQSYHNIAIDDNSNVSEEPIANSRISEKINAKYDAKLNLINNEQQVSIKKIEDNFVNNGNDQGAFAERNEVEKEIDKIGKFDPKSLLMNNNNLDIEESNPITDLFGKQENIDPKTLLMNPNSLDLQNELSIKQEQDDLEAVDSVNKSIDFFDNEIDHKMTNNTVMEEVNEDFSEVNNSDVEISEELYGYDDFSTFINEDEDNPSC